MKSFREKLKPTEKIIRFVVVKANDETDAEAKQKLESDINEFLEAIDNNGECKSFIVYYPKENNYSAVVILE